MDASEKRAGSLAWMVLGAVTALACVSAIGAATTLVFLTQEASEPAGTVPTNDADCAVVAWKSGSVHCFRNAAGEASKPARRGAVVVIQAQADSTR